MNPLLIVIPILNIILAGIILRRTISRTIGYSAFVILALAVILILNGLDIIPTYEIGVL